jgi:hypothetical protein
VNYEQWLDGTASGAVRYFSLGRHALAEALRVAGAKPGDSILLPEYLCRDILASLAAVGATPCWYPVGEDLTPSSEPDDWPLARVVVAADYFGFPQSLVSFRKYAERTGALIIEDNAHGFLSRDGNGEWLGTRADLGVFSLRKTLPLADGAALLVMRPELARRLAPQDLEAGAGYAPSAARKASLRRTPVLGPPAAAVMTGLVRALRLLRTGHAIPPPDAAAETVIPHPPTPHEGLAAALAAVDPQREINRRRELYRTVERTARSLDIEPLFPDLPSLVAPYGFPFRADPGPALQSLQRWASHRGLDLIRWPDLPDAIAASAPAHYRNLHLVNFLW